MGGRDCYGPAVIGVVLFSEINTIRVMNRELTTLGQINTDVV